MAEEQVASKKRVKARVREENALRLRIAGGSYQAIADALDLSVSGARKAVIRALDRTIDNVNAEANELRALEIARLDRLYLKMAPLADQGSMGAVDRCLRIQERRAKLLGLDAPTKIANTDPQGNEIPDDARYNRAISTLADALRKALPGDGTKPDGDVGSGE